MRSTLKRLRGAVLAGAITLILTSSAPAQLTPAQMAAVGARVNAAQFQVNPLLFTARVNAARNVALVNQAAALTQLAPFAAGSNFSVPINYGALVPAYNPLAALTSSPALASFPTLPGGGATLTSNPYATSPGLAAAATSPGYGAGAAYNPYAYSSYYDPYGGYFRGVGDLVTSYGKYYNQYQDARLKSVQVEQAKIDLRRNLFDEWLYYRSKMPTYADLREASIKRDLLYARTQPNSTDIMNASSLNTLLTHLKDVQAKGMHGPTIDLSPDTLKKINLRTDRGGNVGLLKNGGKLNWPLSLRMPMFEKLRQSFEQRVEQAVERAKFDGQPIGEALLRDLNTELAALSDTLDKNINKLSIGAYSEGNRYLGLLRDAVRALEDQNVSDFFVGKYAPAALVNQGKTVDKLVDYMLKNGLTFAPATPGDEPAYRALQNFLAAYDDGLTRLAARTP